MSQDFQDLRDAGLDVDAAIRFTGGADKYIKGLNRFYNAYETNSNRIKNSYENHNIEDYTIIVHSLKSNSRMIGDNELGDFAEELQYAGQGRDMDKINANTSRLLEMYANLVETIKPYVDAEEKDSGLSGDAAIKILKELLDALEDYDYNDSIILHSKLAEYDFKPSDKTVYSDIKEEIEIFNYDAAGELAQELIDRIS